MLFRSWRWGTKLLFDSGWGLSRLLPTSPERWAWSRRGEFERRAAPAVQLQVVSSSHARSLLRLPELCLHVFGQHDVARISCVVAAVKPLVEGSLVVAAGSTPATSSTSGPPAWFWFVGDFYTPSRLCLLHCKRRPSADGTLEVLLTRRAVRWLSADKQACT
jgi:hypothetical protein